MSYGSCTTTYPSTAKLEISLLLKPQASVASNKRSIEALNEGEVSNGGLEVPPLTRSISVPLPEARRISESSPTSVATTPSLATATTSRQPSLTAITTPDLGKASMDVSLAPRPILPPLRHTPPPPHQSMYLQHTAPPNYVNPHYQPVNHGPSYSPPIKRQRTSSPPPLTQPAKRQSKWTQEEDARIIELRASGMKWEDISKNLPGRSAISCRLHYQNYLERRSEWDEEKKNRLARLYERLKSEMWSNLAAELGIPWRAAEAMHWQIGEAGMASRAGVTPFSLASTQAPSRHSSYHSQGQSHHPPHQRGHSDPPYDNMYHQQRYSSAHPEPRHYHGPAPLPPLPPPPMIEKEEVIRLTRPSSPMLTASPGEQSRRVLPSMAELDQGLTAAAMADAHRSSMSSRR